MSPPRLFGLILAAGEGRRMGGNKGILELDGVPVITRLLAEVASSKLSGALVVTGSEEEELTPLILRGGGTPVRNASWREGQTTSVRAALRALPPDADGFMIHPVDHALVTATDLDLLVLAFEEHPTPQEAIVRPRHGDAWGHPVLFGANLREAFLSLPKDTPANAVYRQHRERVHSVEVPNPHIGFDLDTPEDLRRAEQILRASS